MDPITLTGIAALDAALVGAGVGAATSAATGGDPFKGALIGGVTGGGGSLLGGAGGAAASAVDDVATNVTPEVATTFMNENIPTLLTNEATRTAAAFNPSQFATQGFTDGVMNQYAPNFADIAMGKSADFTGGGYGGSFLNNIGSSALDALKQNSVNTAMLGLNVYDRMNQQPQVQAPQLGIIRPQESSEYQPILNAILQKRKPYSLLG